MKLQLKSALSHVFEGTATSQELGAVFCALGLPLIAAVVVYCVVNHFSR